MTSIIRKIASGLVLFGAFVLTFSVFLALFIGPIFMFEHTNNANWFWVYLPLILIGAYWVGDSLE